MTPHGLVTPSTGHDARELEANLRPEDRRELEDVGGQPALQTLLLGALCSRPSLTLRTHEGDLIGMLGAVPGHTSSHGILWMAATPLITRKSVAFLRGSLDVLEALHQSYDTLYNVTDARNPVHHRWLRWLGFSLIRKIDQYGPNRVPVIEFARIRQFVTSSPPPPSA